MEKTTYQAELWVGQFGRDYTERNTLDLDEMEDLYRRSYGITRTDLNESFLRGIDRSIRILEVGSNIGNQLLCLQRMEFKNLYGIELQSYAVELSKSRTQGINIIQGSVFDIPFKDGYFELIFTSALLIHISPSDIHQAMKEIHRCTNTFIWGFEYYADEYTEIVYRGRSNMLWKANFAKIYLQQFDDLELVKELHLRYTNNDNVDTMFLLKKRK